MPPKRWILLVDDDPMMLDMMQEFVQGPEIRSTTATDATQAFIQARDLKPALIISDMHMPNYYGSAILTELRKDPRTRDIPFIFVTGMDQTQAQALLPANDPKVRLLVKPVNLTQLASLIDALTGLKLGPSEP